MAVTLWQHKMARENRKNRGSGSAGAVSFGRRLGIYFGLWGLGGMAFLCLPFSDAGRAEWQELMKSFVLTPLEVSIGLAALLPVPSRWVGGMFLYLAVHAMVTLSQRRICPFLILCGVQVVHTAVAAVGLVRFLGRDAG